MSMWPKLWQMVCCIITICMLIDEGYGLMCLRCETRNVNGNCKKGGRFRLSTKRYQSCYGRKPRCYIKATVDEDGNAVFKRGCTLRKICQENDGSDIEYCSTCFHKYCNHHSVDLDPEVEDYLKDLRGHKNNTVTSTEATTQAHPSPEALRDLSGIVSERLPKNVPETVPETLPKPVSENVATTVPETVPVIASESVPVTVSEFVATNVTEK